MLSIPPFQVTLTRRCNKNIPFLLPILYRVKCSTPNCIPNTVHYPSSPAVTQTNSGIRKTSSTGMWPKFVFPANTLQYISLNTAAGSFKALMTKTPAGDFYPLLGQLLRNSSNHSLSCSSVSSRLCTGTLQTPHIELCAMTLLMHWLCFKHSLRKVNF